MTDRSSKEVAAAAAETAIVSGSSAATAASFQALAAKFVPYAMSACGTIIPGIGTIHVPGGVAASLQTFSMATVVMPVAIAGGGAYLVYINKKMIGSATTNSYQYLCKQLKQSKSLQVLKEMKLKSKL
jgi:hypothetical protein